MAAGLQEIRRELLEGEPLEWRLLVAATELNTLSTPEHPCMSYSFAEDRTWVRPSLHTGSPCLDISLER